MDDERENIVEISEELKKKYHDDWAKHPMRKPRIDKITVNMGVGASGIQLEKAMNVLESLTGQKPVKRNSRKTIRGWGIRKYEPISTIVTLRGDIAVEFLKRTLEIHENLAWPSSLMCNTWPFWKSANGSVSVWWVPRANELLVTHFEANNQA